MPGQDYYSMIQLEELAKARRAKLAAEMTHQGPGVGQTSPPGISFEGMGNRFGRNIYRGPGEAASVFDLLGEYSTVGNAAMLINPTTTTAKSTIDDLLGLAEVEQAYKELAPAGDGVYPMDGPYGQGTIQGDTADFVLPMISDPFLAVGAGMKGAEMGGAFTRRVLDEWAKNSAGSPMAGQRTGRVTSPGFEGPPTQDEYVDMLGRRAEAMFEPDRGPEFTIGGNQRGMIGGPLSPIADLDALKRAQAMKADGATADDIYTETGWWLDHPDGVPRFETDDSATQLLPINEEQAKWLVRKPGTSGNEEPLGPVRNILDAPGAYSAYPDLADIRVRGEASRSGAYSPPTYGVRVKGPYDPPGPDFPEGIEAGVEQIEGGGYKYPEETKGVLLHELQHAIQERENMAKGGSPQGAPIRKDLSAAEDAAFSHDWYNRLAGEVEARSAARRADMTAEERAAEPFWKWPAPNKLTPEEASERLSRGEEVWAASDWNQFQVPSPDHVPDLPLYDGPARGRPKNFMGPDFPYEDQIIKMNSTGPAESVKPEGLLGDAPNTAGKAETRSDLQAYLKTRGLPATGKTEDLARMAEVARKPITEWTQDEFQLMRPHMYIHQDFKGTDPALLMEGLNRGMVDNVKSMMDPGYSWANQVGQDAYLMFPGDIKYKRDTPYIESAKPFHHIPKPDKPTDIDDLLGFPDPNKKPRVPYYGPGAREFNEQRRRESGPKATGLLDSTEERPLIYTNDELSVTPDVPQFPLDRFDAPRGKPAALKGLLGKRTANRMSEYAKAGEEGGKGWYNLDPLRAQFVAELGEEEGNAQFRRYTDHLAATSPREKVKQNVKRASLFHGMERSGEPFAHLKNPGKGDGPGTEIPQGYGSLGHETQRYLLSDLEGGGHFSSMGRPKTSSFAENLSGNQTPMTIDTHNMAALMNNKGTKRSPTPGEYKYIENFEADIADQLGMTPAQFQASVWVGAGKDTGVADVRPFLDVFNDVVVDTAKKRGQTPAEALKDFITGKAPLLGLAGVLSAGTLTQGPEEETDGNRSTN